MSASDWRRRVALGFHREVYPLPERPSSAPDALTRRTPGQAFRDLSRGVQDVLDRAAGSRPDRGLIGRLAHWLARTWTTAWWIAVTSLAACAAWAGSLLVGLTSPVAAAVAALLTVALSLNRSLRTGMSLVVATAVALVLAFALYQFWGIHVWTAGVIVAASLVIGRVMRLGAEGSLQIPATALFVYVLGEGLTDEVIINRILATLLGVGIGVVFSFIAHPERPEERITETLAELGRRLGDLLVVMGDATEERATRRQAAEWLTEARRLSLAVQEVGSEIDELGLGRRLAVGQERAMGRALLDQYSLLKHTCGHVNDIARGIFDATSRGSVMLPQGVATLLSSTGAALSIHADALPRTIDDGDPATGMLRALEIVEVERVRSVASIKELDDTGAMLLGGALVTEVDRMVDRLSGSPQSDSDEPGSARAVDSQR